MTVYFALIIENWYIVGHSCLKCCLNEGSRTVLEHLANDCEIKSLNPTGGQHKEKNGDK